MTKHGDGNQFDVSDVVQAGPIDSIDGVLDVASSVLGDYGSDPGATRIERMARWIVHRVGDPVAIASAGSLSKARTESGIGALRCMDFVALAHEGKVVTPRLTPDEARELAVALLRMAELAETDD